jgi:transcriptional regulator with XRE-family HTH domain
MSKHEDSQKPPPLRGGSELGPRLRRYRRERGWTQAQLAKKAGVSTHTVSRLERSLDRPLPRTAQALARALGVEVSRLLGLLEQPVLFPHSDERRMTLIRRIVDLTEDEVEQAQPLIDQVLDRVQRETFRRSRPDPPRQG